MGNFSKASMKNYMLDFYAIKCFGINTRTSKVAYLLLDGSSLHQTELKLTLMGLLGDILVLLLVEVFFVRVCKNLLVLSLRFLKFRLLWLLSFMELYMKEAQKMRFTNICFERNSALVCGAFIVRTNVPWMFRNQ